MILTVMSDLIFHSYWRKSQPKSNLPLKPGILPAKTAVLWKGETKNGLTTIYWTEVQIPWRYNLFENVRNWLSWYGRIVEKESTQEIKKELMLERFNTANLRRISICWQLSPMSTTHAWICNPCSSSQILNKFRKERYLAHKLNFTRNIRLRGEPPSSDWAGISETQQI